MYEFGCGFAPLPGISEEGPPMPVPLLVAEKRPTVRTSFINEKLFGERLRTTIAVDDQL
jgi:hypothetical protein